MTRDQLIASVERMQEELACLRAVVAQPTAPLSMGDRVDATDAIKHALASLGNLTTKLRRGIDPEGVRP